MAKIIEFDKYKKNKKLNGPQNSTCVSVSLDRNPPKITVNPDVSLQDFTVAFDFNVETSGDWIYKTWGDYDLTGLNPDLCGETEAQAPWVSGRNSIDYSVLGDNPFGYDFYFKFRDDVWNESSVKLENVASHTTTSIQINLDTHAPVVQVVPRVSLQNQTVTLRFDFDAVDILDFKTWGDYDPTGLNHDCCGTTELNAPWVSIRNGIEFNLGPVVGDPKYNFYFKFRDDVWNEYSVELENVTENPVVLYFDDLTRAAECYQTIIINDDSAVSEYISTIENLWFEHFIYTETSWIDVEKHLLYSPTETDALSVFAEDFVDSEDSSYICFPTGLSVSSKIRVWNDADVTFFDFASGVFKRTFVDSEVEYRDSSTDSRVVIDIEFQDASDPYAVFLYFAVNITCLHASSEEFILGVTGEDIITDSELSALIVEDKDSAFGIDRFTEKEFTVHDFDLIRDFTVINALSSDEIVLLEETYIDVALSDSGFEPEPQWGFVVNSVDAALVGEVLENTIDGVDLLTVFEEAEFDVQALARYFGRDLFAEKEFVSTLTGTSIESGIPAVAVQDSVLPFSDVVLDVPVGQHSDALSFVRPDVDYLIREKSVGRDIDVLTVPVDYLQSFTDWTVLSVVASDSGAEFIPDWQFKVNVEDLADGIERFANSILVEESFPQVFEYGLLGVPDKDSGAASFNTIKEFNTFDFITGFGSPVVEVAVDYSTVFYDHAILTGVLSDEGHEVVPDWRFKVNVEDLADGIERFGNTLAVEDFSIQTWETGVTTLGLSAWYSAHYFVRADADLLIRELVSGRDVLEVEIPVDYTYFVYESTVVNVAVLDSAEEQVPDWKFRVNVEDVFTSTERIETGIPAIEFSSGFDAYAELLLGQKDSAKGLDIFREKFAILSDSGVDVETPVISLEAVDDLHIFDSTVISVTASYQAGFQYRPWITADLLIKEDSFGRDVLEIEIPVDALYVPLETGVITVVYKDWGVESDPKKTLEIIVEESALFRPTLEIEVPVLDTIQYFTDSVIQIPISDAGIGTDRANFAKWLLDSGTDIESGMVAIAGEDSVWVDFTVVLDALGSDYFSYTDLLTEFYKNLFDTGVVYSPHSVIDLPATDSITLSDSVVISTLGNDFVFYKEDAYLRELLLQKDIGVVSEHLEIGLPVWDQVALEEQAVIELCSLDYAVSWYHTNIVEYEPGPPIRYVDVFEFITGRDLAAILLPEFESGGLSEYPIISTFSKDSIVGKDLATEFYRELFESAVGQFETSISQGVEDVAYYTEYAPLEIVGHEIGFVESKYRLLVLFKVYENLSADFTDILSIPDRDIAFGYDSLLLESCLFDFGVEVEEKQYITEYLVQKEEVAGLEDGHFDFYVDDQAVSFEELVFEFFFKITGTVEEEFIPSYKEFTVYDVGNPCINTIIYDPTITQRDLIYWWQPNYPTGGLSIGGTFNPDWGKPILPGDVDYPYYKDDPRYGQVINYLSDSIIKDVFASFWEVIPHSSLYPPEFITKTFITDSTIYTTDMPVFKFSVPAMSKVEYGCRKQAESYIIRIYYYSGSLPWVHNFYIYVTRRYYIYDYDEETGEDYSRWDTEYLVEPLYLDATLESDYWETVDVIPYYHSTYSFKKNYDLDPPEFEFDFSDRYTPYELESTKSTFQVTIRDRITWTDLFQAKEYNLSCDLAYQTTIVDINPLYKESRRRFIYSDDGWVVPTDVLYYEPTTFKLYVNMGCSPWDGLEVIPKDAMEKFIFDKLQKYSYLDIVAPYIGDHAESVESNVISFFFTIPVRVMEHAWIEYSLYFRDAGYTCEDIVVYSLDGLEKRDLAFWWNEDYPIKEGFVIHEPVPNELLGDPIRPGDFDYPYLETDPRYGTVISDAKDPICEAEFSNFEYHHTVRVYDRLPVSTSNKTQVYPINLLTDGQEVIITGSFKANVGSFDILICGEEMVSPSEPNIDDIPYMGTGRLGYTFVPVIQDVTAEVVHTYVDGRTYDFNSKICYITNFRATVRLQPLLNVFNKYAPVVSRKPYLCLVVTVSDRFSEDKGYARMSEKHTYIDEEGREYTVGRDSWGLDYELAYSASVINYNAEYLSYRAPGYNYTDLGFTPRDFFEDFFGFKLYVNLGCGPDLDAFSVEPATPLERWVFTTARRGNIDVDYLFSGNLGQLTESAVENLVWEDHFKVEEHFYFNDFEFTVFDFGHLQATKYLSVLADDEFLSDDSYAVIEIPKEVVGTIDVRVTQLNMTTLHEFATYEVTPMFDLFTADVAQFSLEMPTIEILEKETAELDSKISFKVMVTLHDTALISGQELFAIPVDDGFYVQDDSVITLKEFFDIEGEEESHIYEFIFLYENGEYKLTPVLEEPPEDVFGMWGDSVIDIAAGCRAIGKEYISPTRSERYFDIGYVCFWVQIVNYKFVIDWLAGHFVDYFVDKMEAEYYRFTTCFGMPPGGWPAVKNYPSPDGPDGILPKPRPGRPGVPHLVRDPDDPQHRYRHKEPQPNEPDRQHGYQRIPGPGGEGSGGKSTRYIIDPTNPPGPYEWQGGTAAYITKSISTSNFTEYMLVEDGFHFALFNSHKERISDVQVMTLKDTQLEDGSVISGACFGAMIFRDLEPNTLYYIYETDAEGNIREPKYESEYSGITYSLPTNGAAFRTGDDGKCVSGFDFKNIVESINPYGPGGTYDHPMPKQPLPVITHDYVPKVYPDDYPITEYPPGEAPFTIPGHSSNPNGEGSFPPHEMDPYVDGEYFPPIVPSEYANPDDDSPVDVPGFEGKLITSPELAYGKESAVFNIPVEMLGVVWELHYIPADFILELSGMRIEWMDGFEIELDEPFRFDSTGFEMTLDEPFRFDATEFYIEEVREFYINEDPMIISVYREPFTLKKVFFEIGEFADDRFVFDEIFYEGEQQEAFPEVHSVVSVYTGNPIALANPSGRYGTIYYQLEGESDWSTEIPKQTDVGTYVIHWYAAESMYFRGYGDVLNYFTVMSTITKATPTLILSDIKVPFNETVYVDFYYTSDGVITCTSDDFTICTAKIIAIEPVLGGPEDEAFHGIMQVNGVNCGSTGIDVSISPGHNYNSLSTECICTVTPGIITFTVRPITMDYTGIPITGDITVHGPSEYEILYSTHTLEESGGPVSKVIDFYTDVGEYAVYFKITAKNYETAYGWFTLIINPVPQEIVVIANRVTYTGEEFPLIKMVSGVFGTMWYSLDGQNWITSFPTATLPGLYPVYWYCIGDDNHLDNGSSLMPNEVIAEIEKMTIDVHIDDQTVDIQDPDLWVYIPTPSTGKMRVDLSVYKYIDAWMVDTNVVIKPLVVGSTRVYVRQEEDEFYKSHTFIFNTRVIDTRIVYIVNDVSADYTGEIIALSDIRISKPSAAICTIRYAQEPIISSTALYPTPSFYSNAGEYKIYFMISAPEYRTAYDFYTLTINKAANSVTVKPVTFVYDTTSHDLVVVLPGYHGVMYYRLGLDGPWSVSIPRSSMPGNYTIYYYCDGSPNYEDVGSAELPKYVISVIDKKTPAPVTFRETLEVEHGEYLIPIVSDGDGAFTSIVYSSTTYVDTSLTFIETLSPGVGMLHIVPLYPGTSTGAQRFDMWIYQAEGTFYKANTILGEITVTKEGKLPIVSETIVYRDITLDIDYFTVQVLCKKDPATPSPSDGVFTGITFVDNDGYVDPTKGAVDESRSYVTSAGMLSLKTYQFGHAEVVIHQAEGTNYLAHDFRHIFTFIRADIHANTIYLTVALGSVSVTTVPTPSEGNFLSITNVSPSDLLDWSGSSVTADGTLTIKPARAGHGTFKVWQEAGLRYNDYFFNYDLTVTEAKRDISPTEFWVTIDLIRGGVQTLQVETPSDGIFYTKISATVPYHDPTLVDITKSTISSTGLMTLVLTKNTGTGTILYAQQYEGTYYNGATFTYHITVEDTGMDPEGFITYNLVTDLAARGAATATRTLSETYLSNYSAHIDIRKDDPSIDSHVAMLFGNTIFLCDSDRSEHVQIVFTNRIGCEEILDHVDYGRSYSGKPSKAVLLMLGVIGEDGNSIKLKDMWELLQNKHFEHITNLHFVTDSTGKLTIYDTSKYNVLNTVFQSTRPVNYNYWPDYS